MPRKQPPPDPSKGPVEAFAYELYERRKQAGNPPYRDMADKAFVSYTSLSRAAQGHKLPTWDVAEAYLKACDVTESDILAIYGRWEVARIEAAQLKNGAPAAAIAPAPRSALEPVPEPDQADQVPPRDDDTRRKEEAFDPPPVKFVPFTGATVGPAMGVTAGSVPSSAAKVILEHVDGRVHVSAGRGHGGSRRRPPEVSRAAAVRYMLAFVLVIWIIVLGYALIR